MLPDDDKRYAIETCRSSESVFKKWFNNKWHTISAFVGCVIIIEYSYILSEGTLNLIFCDFSPKLRRKNNDLSVTDKNKERGDRIFNSTWMKLWTFS